MSDLDQYLDAFPDVLRQMREARGFTQEALGHEVGLDRTFISMLERRKRNPSLETIVKLSLALDMRPEEFIAECGKSYRA